MHFFRYNGFDKRLKYSHRQIHSHWKVRRTYPLWYEVCDRKHKNAAFLVVECAKLPVKGFKFFSPTRVTTKPGKMVDALWTRSFGHCTVEIGPDCRELCQDYFNGWWCAIGWNALFCIFQMDFIVVKWTTVEIYWHSSKCLICILLRVQHKAHRFIFYPCSLMVCGSRPLCMYLYSSADCHENDKLIDLNLREFFIFNITNKATLSDNYHMTD